MQKKIIALALASLATGAAFAQSNVTIYGRMDTGFESRLGNSGGVNNIRAKNEIGSGLELGSRIGFKGVEDLGNGLKAIFETEYGIGIDQTAAGTTNATWTNRHSYVGLTGGFGTAIAGRLDGIRYGIFNAFDPFGGGGMGNITQITQQVDRADNAVAYISPNFGGFGVVLAYATNIAGPEHFGNGVGVTAPGFNGVDHALESIMLTFDNGPVSARLDYEQVATPGTSGDRTWVITGAGSYDLGVVKLSALLDQIKNDTAGFKEQTWLVGAKAPIGKFTAKAVIGGVRDKSLTAGVDVPKNNSLKWGLGMDYAFSKRTNLYADYGQIHNGANAARQINAAANSNSTGYGTLGFDLGIAHNF